MDAGIHTISGDQIIVVPKMKHYKVSVGYVNKAGIIQSTDYYVVSQNAKMAMDQALVVAKVAWKSTGWSGFHIAGIMDNSMGMQPVE